MLQSTRQRIKDLEPALRILLDLQQYEKVLLHAFSNGGAHASWLLAKTYRERTGALLPIDKVIFDSTPGSQDYHRALAAFSVGLPKNPILGALGAVILRLVLATWFAYGYLTGNESIIDTVRRGLNDIELFDTATRRLYVYSVRDPLIAWEDVESHAREAEGNGYDVRRVKYLESGHVAHMLNDETRYWGSVTGLWRSR